MPNPETLLALAARAEAGGDAGLSDDVWRALGWQRLPESDQLPNRISPAGYDPHKWGWWRNPDGVLETGPRPDLRVSIDAQEAVAPRIVELIHGRYPENAPWEYIAYADDAAIGRPASKGVAPTEPLARLAAKLRALAAKDTPNAP